MKYLEITAFSEYRIYGREKGKGKFKPLDLQEGTFVKNLMYASLIPEKDVKRVLESLNKENSDFEFKAVKA